MKSFEWMPRALALGRMSTVKTNHTGTGKMNDVSDIVSEGPFAWRCEGTLYFLSRWVKTLQLVRHCRLCPILRHHPPRPPLSQGLLHRITKS